MIEDFKRLLRRSKVLVAVIKVIQLSWLKYRRIKCLLARPYKVKKYFASYLIRKLQIGAGPNILEGWLNTDEYPESSKIVFLDVTNSFPFKAKTFDYIFSEHHIEHLTYNNGQLMLRECYRVLKPGGRIRISTPDLEILIGLHTLNKSVLQQRYVRWIIDQYIPQHKSYMASFVISNAFQAWGHRFIYDRETLQNSMEDAGFVDITRYKPGESDDVNLRGIESHGKVTGNEEMSKFITMVLEARRPPI